MLKTRIITALVLLGVLIPILYSGSILLFSLVATLFFGAAMWECQRLFKKPAPLMMALVWSALFLYLSFGSMTVTTSRPDFPALFALCIVFWCVRLVPALRFGLPVMTGLSNGVLSGMYGVAIFGCFVAMVTLFLHSPVFLLSAMAMVWIADVGAYFSGKAFGKRKLAPSISPGKSWEGAIGGWLALLLIGAASAVSAGFADTFPAKVLMVAGWPGLILALTVVSMASVVGDLFESLLKRRAGMKDSSSLLPGHGGVLDRIDALIPVLPIVALFDFWWK
ncbi:phosphatidate cytidylyltransferase [Undibacterium piscinae]|uniref:Phosphatidate cytidylyltransferase n=1 Tax=Undibacterium piscinae TaxID=2495591 RepID=A0A6M3ZZY6_9BURK|nr:phosphatidate cytidylyltransferase [Undibacterium piscinae]